MRPPESEGSLKRGGLLFSARRIEVSYREVLRILAVSLRRKCGSHSFRWLAVSEETIIWLESCAILYFGYDSWLACSWETAHRSLLKKLLYREEIEAESSHWNANIKLSEKHQENTKSSFTGWLKYRLKIKCWKPGWLAEENETSKLLSAANACLYNIWLAKKTIWDEERAQNA